MAVEDLVGAILEHNSSVKNTVCCIEEMSELTKVLTKKLRQSPKFSEEKLLEELSQVMLMCCVIAKEHNLEEADILHVQFETVRKMHEEIE